VNVWSLKNCDDFDSLALDIAEALMRAPEVAVGSWQSQDVKSRPEMVSFELRHAHIAMSVPKRQDALATMTSANLPWAEDHFQERVGGEPLNPPPSEQWWPYAQAGNAAHKEGEKFSHTYPERFWPKHAHAVNNFPSQAHWGIRYRYGDLQDVVNLLRSDITTRQAYLPVWFPEDTGSVSGQRVPCTLGYHFLCREGRMDIEYHIRSCDFMRHWRDDVYMAGRLLQWVCGQLNGENPTTHSSQVRPSKLIMNIGSFHIFRGDRAPLANWIAQEKHNQGQSFAHRISRAL
jgi:hypothetical protein